MKNQKQSRPSLVAISGGADSLYLLVHLMKDTTRVVAAHYNHGVRGKDSEEDETFVRTFCMNHRIPFVVERTLSGPGLASGGKEKVDRLAGFEARARRERYRFLFATKEKYGAEKIYIAHTADDQVETVLMRILEGAGISGLKGMPRSTEDGIERPLLDTWREEILAYLKKRKIPYRIDKSNFDTRFERNWIRHVLIPLLEKRYGKAVKKRIFALGERFRELDTFIDQNARSWLGKNKEPNRIPRKAYAALPSLLRIRILQILCFEHIGTAPNERLLASMDKLIVSGGPSARLNVGKGATLKCRYGEAVLSPPGKREETAAGRRRPARTGKGKPGQGPTGKKLGRKVREETGTPEPVVQMEGPGLYGWNAGGPYDDNVPPGSLRAFQWKEQGKIAPGRMRRLAEDGRFAAFDSETVSTPFSIRPLKAGDRIWPFGLDAEKKVKEILIDRKIPREERWGRPVVCDAYGKILWIPGVLRSAHAPLTPRTKRTIVLRADR